jgi:hypothetical protein
MGDPTNAEDWADADVLIAPLGSAVPATVDDPFDSDWESVGYIDGDTGISHGRSQTKTEKFAWGAGKFKDLFSKYTEVVTWKSWEYNETTRSLLHPGSAPGVRTVPKAVPVMLAIEKTSSDGEVRRLITSSHVIVDPAIEEKDQEGDILGYTFAAGVIPNSDKELWIEQPAFGGPTLVSLALTGTASVVVGELTQLVATATYSDSSTRDVTAGAIWSSATPSKATVPYGAGVVKGIAAGTSVVTARYGSVSDTETVTVTSS